MTWRYKKTRRLLEDDCDGDREDQVERPRPRDGEHDDDCLRPVGDWSGRRAMMQTDPRPE